MGGSLVDWIPLLAAVMASCSIVLIVYALIDLDKKLLISAIAALAFSLIVLFIAKSWEQTNCDQPVVVIDGTRYIAEDCINAR